MTPDPARLPIETEFLFRVVIQTDRSRIRKLEATPWGTAMDVAVAGGTVTGPKINGVLLNIGADWGLVTRQGEGAALDVTDLDCRVIIETDDSPACLIEMRYAGVGFNHPGVAERPAMDGVRDAGGYYFRTTPRFRTAAPKYDFLNRVVAVASGYHRVAAGPIYDVYAVL
ncbi:DUF3237 domain-containing protein [Limibaculum sp. FT325]|uniref:DUF3237 domain-containing protein n=1 Tax=Thermohalobaculum sediminis TaxID=2939436 RepID=UPI0020C0B7A9|nr:DUF3237 domain-containing protein [Limibaculum sediminis]MCL5777200.1 DUF3237 domain-containing protein [Limibaculum sediminis]